MQVLDGYRLKQICFYMSNSSTRIIFLFKCYSVLKAYFAHFYCIRHNSQLGPKSVLLVHTSKYVRTGYPY